jgi:hypothetical protein
MKRSFDLGSLELSGEWKLSGQVELVETAFSGSPLSVVIRRTPTAHTQVEAAIGQIVEELRANFRGLFADGPKAQAFEDGAAGAAVTTRLAIGPGLAALQLHAVRIDRGVLTHLSATLDEKQGQRLAAVGKLIASYAPPP